jgi:N6-L-threonylcarbamoyladenine synthase
MCQKLDFVFQYLDSIGAFKSENSRNLVVSGGVAANLYFRTAIEKIASHHGFKTRFPPTNLVTDNATMIAWTAIEMLNAR